MKTGNLFRAVKMRMSRQVASVLFTTHRILSVQKAALPDEDGHEHGNGIVAPVRDSKTPTAVKITRGATIRGEVVDIVCYTRHNSRGEDHAKCALYCSEQGIPLGILDETSGDIYLPLPEGHTDPNKVLVDYIAREVAATGTVYERGGLKQIEIEKIEMTQ